MEDGSTVATSVPCVKCRYDLCGLEITGRCPECGEAVVRSVPECPRCVMSRGEQVALRRSGPDAGIWKCSVCHGAGFEAGFLQLALKRQRGILSIDKPRTTELVSQTAVRCGHCQTPATSIIVDRQVMIERCQACGFVWLDQHELEAIADYVTRVIGERPVPRNVEQIVGDSAALRQAVSGDSPVAEAVAFGIFELIASVLFG